MPTRVINGVGSPSNTSGYTSGNPVYVGDTVPQGRMSASGSRPIRISGLHLDLGGGGSVQLVVWDADGSNGAGSGIIGLPSSVGRVSASLEKFIGNANLQDIRVGWQSPSSSVRFGRSPVSGRTVVDGQGDYPSSSLSGLWTYDQVPAAPTMVSATPGPAGTVRVIFFGSADTGDAPITGWRLQRAEDPGFTVGVVEVSSNGATDLTLTPGKTYWFRAAGRNYVSDVFGTSGPWSGAISATMRSGGKVRVGGVWKPAIVKVRVGGVWKDGIVRVRQGGTWKDVL